MRAVVQRVRHARVVVEDTTVGEIGVGLLVLVGAARGDTDADADKLADRVAGMRIFSDADGKLNLALAQVEGQVLAVSQFTLLGEAMTNRRPSFTGAANYDDGQRLFERFVSSLRKREIAVETGVFGADMQVELVNDGPVTILLDTRVAG